MHSSYHVFIFGENMSENSAELVIELLLEGGEPAGLDELTRPLRTEVEELNLDSVGQISVGLAPEATKTAQIEYDPTKTSAKHLEALIKSLNKSLKK